uniref:CSON001671 protein n=1 Tax=Culicoides sonorensis TaxID=179676 RepID=A0A336MUZ0_CULSO
MNKQDLEALESGDESKASQVLQAFVDKHSQTFDLQFLTSSGQWTRIWTALFLYLKKPGSSIHMQCLATLRICSRDKTYINDCLQDDQFDALLSVANIGARSYKATNAVQIEALKCLCNLVFQSTKCQDMCLRNAAVEGIVNRLKTYKEQMTEYEIYFFDMKLLFLITALNTDVRTKVRDDYHGLTYLVETLDVIMKSNDTKELFDKEVDLINEVLKVLFNLTVRNPTTVSTEEEEESQFNRLAIVIHELILYRTRSKEKLNELRTNIINLLTSIPTACYCELIVQVPDEASNVKHYEGYNMEAVDILIDYLKEKFEGGREKLTQYEILSPVLTDLVKCVKCSPVMRRYIRGIILPPLRDVKKRPEEGSELRNHLCKLLTNPATQLADLSAELLFILCKENVGRMIKYTGYGNAAGLFANRGLLAGRSNPIADYSSDSEDSDTEEYKQIQDKINPVLGCYEPPHPNPLEGRSDEQKEYEAMELVNLIDKLHRTGVIKPCKIGDDGRPEPVDHILELQEEIPEQQRAHIRKT